MANAGIQIMNIRYREEVEPARANDYTGAYGTDPEPYLYSPDKDLELQRCVDTNLQRNLGPTTSQASSLDENHWEATLSGVLGMLNDRTSFAHIVRKYVGALKVPDKFSHDIVAIDTFIHDDGKAGARTHVSCPDGGRYTATETSSSAGLTVFSFDNCVFGSDIVDGYAERSTHVNEFGLTVTSLVFDDFSVVSGARSIRIAGGKYEYDNGYPSEVSMLSGVHYQLVNDGQTITFTNVDATDSSLSYDIFKRSLSAGFNVSAPWTLDQPLTVTMPIRLTGIPIGGPSSNVGGLLLLETEQGDRVTLDANTGLDNRVLITLDHAGAVSTEYQDWKTLFGQF